MSRSAAQRAENESSGSFNRHDRVRLTKEVNLIRAGSEGRVLDYPAEPSKVWVQFFTGGAHEIPEDSLEPVEARNE